MKYFPLYEEPYKAQLGLKPLDLSEWLERDAEFDRHIDLRRKLIAENRAEVLQILKGNEAACLELYETVAGVVDVPKLANPSAEEALCAIAVSVQEDFVILTAEAPVRAGAALVCFPSRWLLASKIGQDSDGIHQPVPGFQAIAKQTRGFLERIMPDKPMWRTNWTIHDSDELFCPRPHPHRPVADEKIVESTFFRVERQTLRRLPRTNQVVFSIRTYITPMSEVVADPNRRSVLKKTLVTLAPDVANYKGMGAFVSQLAAAL